MRNSTVSYLLVAAFMATALMAFAPTAQAQQSASIVVAMNAPSDPVKPLQGPLTFSGSVTFQGDTGGYTNVIGVPITYTVTKQPAWATVLVSPATDVIPVPTTPGPTFSGSRPFTVIVTASENAPAFTADQVEITATTTPGAGGKAASGKNAVPIVAGYFSIIDVQLAETIKVERPQTPVVFPVKVTNLGNANTKVTFAVQDKTENLQVPIPNPVTLQSRQAGGQQISTDVPLTIQTPYKNGYMNEVGLVNYKLTSAYALDPKIKGDESSVSVIVTTRGFYVPGPSPLLLVGLLGVAAVLLRRK